MARLYRKLFDIFEVTFNVDKNACECKAILEKAINEEGFLGKPLWILLLPSYKVTFINPATFILHPVFSLGGIEGMLLEEGDTTKIHLSFLGLLKVYSFIIALLFFFIILAVDNEARVWLFFGICLFIFFGLINCRVATFICHKIKELFPEG